MRATNYNHMRPDEEKAFSGFADLGKPLASARCAEMLGEILR